MKDVSEFRLILKKAPSDEHWLVRGINWSIERLFFFRWSFSGYGVHPRANLRSVSTFWTTLVIFSIIIAITGPSNVIPALAHYHVTNQSSIQQGAPEVGETPRSSGNAVRGEEDHTKNLITILLGFFGTWGVLFWRERSSLYDKWKYLAGLYNQYVALGVGESEGAEDDEVKRKILMASLALDLIDLDMWSHVSYRTFFKRVLIKALAHYNSENPSSQIITDRQQASDGKQIVSLRSDKARLAIQKYQHSLVPKSDSPSESEFKLSSVA